MLEEGSQMPQLKQMVFMSLSVQHFLHHRVGGMMGAEFSALSQSSDAAPDTAPGCLAPDVDGSEGSILLGVQLFFAVPDSFFQVSVSRLLLWDLLWSHSSPRDCRGIVAGAVWSSVVYSKTLPCLSPWWYTCEESMQPSYVNVTSTHCSVRVPVNTFLMTFTSWQFEESTEKYLALLSGFFQYIKLHWLLWIFYLL